MDQTNIDPDNNMERKRKFESKEESIENAQDVLIKVDSK